MQTATSYLIRDLSITIIHLERGLISISTISEILSSPPNNFSTTLSGNVSSSGLTLPLNDVTGLGTEGVGVIYQKDSDGNPVTSTIEFVHWTGVSSLNLTLTDTGDRGINGSASGAQAHNSGDTFEVWTHSAYYPLNAVTLSATQTLTNKTLTQPKIGTSIDDTNGNELVKVTATASAINELTLANAATSGSPTISATGGDTNIGMEIKPKGTGSVMIYGIDGWTPDSDTWTYVSATSFKVSGKDVTARFPKGTKIKLTQTTNKYFYVTNATFSTDTTVTITGGSDYSLANATITSPYYSYQTSPQGFPGYFNWVPSWTNLTIGDATVVARYTLIGKTVTGTVLAILGASSSVGTYPAITFPITVSNNIDSQTPIGLTKYYGSGGLILGYVHANGNLKVFGTASTYANQIDPSATVPFTWASGNQIWIQFTYEMT